MTVVPIPYHDPLDVFAPWAEHAWAQLLDSPVDDPARGRYAYIVKDPYATLVSVDGLCLLNGVVVEDDPFAALDRLLKQAPSPLTACPVPFGGGAVGFLGYELGRHLERAPARHPLPQGEPEMALGFYDCLIAFDRQERKAWLIGVGAGGEAKSALWLNTFTQPPIPIAVTPLPKLHPKVELSKPEYLDRVSEVIEYIRAGDIFQANYTVRFVADCPPNYPSFSLYRRLRTLNPAPFAAYLNLPGITIASASPERFLSLSRAGEIEARPIKGTVPRFADAAKDQASAQTLRDSVKDHAENLMIVDLLRNDIGRVAVIGSIKVPVLSGMESFASVHHLVSVIKGQLRPGLGPVHLLRASFPGGSITGAPKVRAMEIIDELEPAPRGAYCGSILWIGFDGAMDSSIVIRTVVITKDRIVTQAGGGIVSDSQPLLEWDEMITKITPALTALNGG